MSGYNLMKDTIGWLIKQVGFIYFFPSHITNIKFRLMITFANSLDPDPARQNVGPDLDPICLALRWYS